MAEINGYLLTKEEENACFELIREMRARKTFTIGFDGNVEILAKNSDQSYKIFWEWIKAIQKMTCDNFVDKINFYPFFEALECCEVEEEE